jgi:hypothetical protein
MFNIDKFDQNMFDSLSDNIKETIRKSPEYRSIGDKPQQQVANSVADLDDDVPF